MASKGKVKDEIAHFRAFPSGFKALSQVASTATKRFPPRQSGAVCMYLILLNYFAFAKFIQFSNILLEIDANETIEQLSGRRQRHRHKVARSISASEVAGFTPALHSRLKSAQTNFASLLLQAPFTNRGIFDSN